MLISGDTLFCISQKDDFNLHWHDIIDKQNHASVLRGIERVIYFDRVTLIEGHSGEKVFIL